jgi:uncharacterized protein (DUF362 family)
MRRRPSIQTLIARAPNYRIDLTRVIADGLAKLGVGASEIQGRRVLLKPNLVEAHAGAEHINTHPAIVRAAAEAFRRLGAAEVRVAEGPGHRRDTLLVLEQSGMAEALREDRLPFVDLNYQEGFVVENAGRRTSLATLTLPAVLHDSDFVVSMAKMKTHHWVGATLSMKNLFGLMPGIYYGWPKNVLHWAGIADSIVDINATVRPDFAIVDGVVGMEGDGPIAGDPREAGVVVMGRNAPAVDATCSRVMGIDPARIGYLATVADWLGPIAEKRIEQRGESIASTRTEFKLLDTIPAQRGLRA